MGQDPVFTFTTSIIKLLMIFVIWLNMRGVKTHLGEYL